MCALVRRARRTGLAPVVWRVAVLLEEVVADHARHLERDLLALAQRGLRARRYSCACGCYVTCQAGAETETEAEAGAPCRQAARSPTGPPPPAGSRGTGAHSTHTDNSSLH